MSKPYRISFTVAATQAEAATKRVESGLLKSEQAAQRLAAGLDKVYRAPPGGAAALHGLQAQTQAIQAQTQALNDLAAARQKAARVKPGPHQTSGGPAATSAGTGPAANVHPVATQTVRPRPAVTHPGAITPHGPQPIPAQSAHAKATTAPVKAQAPAVHPAATETVRSQPAITHPGAITPHGPAAIPAQPAPTQPHPAATQPARPRTITHAATTAPGGPVGTGSQGAAAAAGAQAVAIKTQTAEQLQAIEDKYLLKDYQAGVAHQQRKLIAAQKATAKTAAQKQTEAESLQQLEDQYLMRDQDRRVKYEARKQTAADRAATQQVRQKEKAAAQLQKIEDGYLAREYKGRVNYQKRKAELEQKGFEESQQRQERFLKVAGTFTATAAITGLKIYAEAFHRITEESEAATEAVLKLRKGLGMEAALKGAGQADNQVVSEALKLRVASGLGEEEASDLTRQYLGSNPIALQKGNIKQDVSDEIMRQTAIVQARIGGGVGAGTRGELAGLVAQTQKIETVEQGLGKLEAIRVALTEGRGDDTPLTRQFLKAKGSLVKQGGMVGSDEELAALVGVTSLASPEEAGIRAEQIARFTRGTDPRSMKGLKQTFGVEATDTLEQRLDKIIPKLQEIDKGGSSVVDYLKEHHLANEENARAIEELLPNYDAYKKRTASARETAKTGGKEVLRQNQAYQESAQGLHARAEQAKAAAEVTRGVENRGEEFQALVRAKEASPEMQAINKDPVWGLADVVFGNLKGGNSKTEQRDRAQEAVIRDLEKEAVRVGALKKTEVNWGEDHGSMWDPDARQKRGAELMAKIQEKGGDPLAGGSEDLKKVLQANTHALQENTKAVNAQRGGKPAQPPGPLAPPPLPGAPPGGPVR